jgi:Amt family ammonium transporter
MFAVGKPSAVSMINGMIAGLVAITPAAGFVDGYGAILVGLAAGVIPWVSLNKVGQWSLLKRVDDTFGVLHTHGVAGLVGGLMVGLIANPAMIEYLSNDKKTPAVSVAGLFYGNPHQLLVQAEAAAVIIVWNVVATFVVLKVVSFIVPLRASDGDVEGGDLAIHGIDPVPILIPTPNGHKQPVSSGAG